MRTLAERCKVTGDCVFLLDFANAFNAVSRNLLLGMAAAHPRS